MDTFDIIKLLPKNLVSKFAGAMAETRFPKPVLNAFLCWYCRQYGVNKEESLKDVNSFRTFNAFFKRKLKPSAREIDSSEKTVVSPVDGRIYSVDTIHDGLIMQVKDVYYMLEDLIGKQHAKYYEGGQCVTIYLAPGDYHRIHAPTNIRLKTVSYFPGNLWPVNDTFLHKVFGLFAVNERIFSEFSFHRNRKMGMVKVGAMVVGKIETRYAPFTSNKNLPNISDWEPSEKMHYEKGEEIAAFGLGSTVILLFPKDSVKISDLPIKKKLRMGQPIAEFID